jgi:hypothetical protein
MPLGCAFCEQNPNVIPKLCEHMAWDYAANKSRENE